MQCIEYALTRPAVAAVMVGCKSRAEIEAALAWCDAPAAERDYTAVMTGLERFSWRGHCMYCGHCAPCSAGIDIAAVHKFRNLAQVQGEIPKRCANTTARSRTTPRSASVAGCANPDARSA